MKIKIGIDIYISKEKLHILLTRNVATVVTTYGEVFSFKKDEISTDLLSGAIKRFIQITDDEFKSNEIDDDYKTLGYASFPDLYKKTKLITLRVEEQKVKIFNAKKVKRWYEFEPIEPVEGYEIDEDGIKRLSEKLVDVLRV